MIFNVITIFPQLIKNYLEYGVLSRAIKEKLIAAEIYDLREYAVNKYGQIDGRIFGSGRGMLFRPEPLDQTINLIKKKHPGSRVIYLSPGGQMFNNRTAKRLAGEESVILVSARYEGIDSRIVRKHVDEELSIGDYVLTGGELPALIVMDSVSRFIEGFIKTESAGNDSFENGLLEHDHFTQPIEFSGMNVPDVLRSGNHKEIGKYRLYNSLKKTYFNRIDLLNGFSFIPDGGKTGNEIKALRRKNQQLAEFLKNIEKISKEWKDGGRDSEK